MNKFKKFWFLIVIIFIFVFTPHFYPPFVHGTTSISHLKIKILNPEGRKTLRVGFKIDILDSQTDQVITSTIGATDDNGFAQITWPTNVSTGTYNLRISMRKHLKRKISNLYLPSANEIIFNKVIFGDLNEDGVIDSNDWKAIKTMWGNSALDKDIYEDGIINSFDFAILKKYWCRKDE